MNTNNPHDTTKRDPADAGVPGTYDPDLNLYCFGTGNAQPVIKGDSWPGASLFTAPSARGILTPANSSVLSVESRTTRTAQGRFAAQGCFALLRMSLR